MKERKERGAIVVEATLSLTAFVFAIFMLLLLVNIYYIQSRIGVALNTAAKELSEYSYLYFKLGGDGVMDKLHEGTEDAMETSKNTIYGVHTMLTALGSAGDNLDNLNIEGTIGDLQTAYQSGSSTAQELADKISEDPKGFILGMGYLAVDQAATEGMTLVCKALSKGLMKKNLIAFDGDDADAFLRRYHVVDGLDGLDFNYTTFLPPAKSDYIQIVVSYDVRVVKLLNLDYTFSFRQCTKTLAWARGISKIHPATNLTRNGNSIWDNPSVMARGKYIVGKEKQHYRYTDSGHGFDAYDNSGGANEFISIISLDTTMGSYQTADGIKARLASAYNDMYNKVSKLGDEIEVEDQNGNPTTVHSDPNTRTYTILLVVPENAPDDIIAQAIADLKATYPGLQVEVKKAYGSPSTGEDGGDGGDGGGG